ncbi:MAG: hypothetical protein ACRDKL_07065, partial [Solirubrobacteraceae bacterium]
NYNDAGFTVSGTATSTDPASDTVDIDCYTGTDSAGSYAATVASDVPLDASGQFSTTVPYWQVEDYNTDPCQLRAVPSGTSPSGNVSSFSGPRVLVAYLATTYDHETGQTLLDYYLFAPQLGAADDYDSFPSCGLDDSYLYDPTAFGQQDATGFYCNDYYEDNGGLTVDGAQATAPQDAYYDPSTGPVPGETVPVTQDPANGDVTIDETDPLLVCVSGGSPPCDWMSSGVELERTITQTDSGHIVLIDDRYLSTDGASHQVSVDLVNDEHFEDQDDLLYEFPGQSGFSAYASPDTVPAASGPATIFVEPNPSDYPDGSTEAARGAITYFTAPSQPFSFTYDSEFLAPYTFTVPAGGSVPVAYAYATEFTQAALEQDVPSALDLQIKPAIAFTVPSAGATVSASPVTVTGTVAAGSGVKSVTVNGVAATVSGSSFTASVPLSAGANTLTAVLTSSADGTSSATEAVDYAVGAAATIGAAATTGAASRLELTSASLSGMVTPGTAGVTYQFEYGRTTSYGDSTASDTLSASTAAEAVAASISGLRPGALYHYRLVVTTATGTVAGGDATFETVPRPGARGLTLAVRPKSARHMPHAFTARGRLMLPKGVSRAEGCGGSVTVRFTTAGKTLLRQTESLNSACGYAVRTRFPGSRLTGAGRIRVRASFAGNLLVKPRKARAVTVRYGRRRARAGAARKVG